MTAIAPPETALEQIIDGLHELMQQLQEDEVDGAMASMANHDTQLRQVFDHELHTDLLPLLREVAQLQHEATVLMCRRREEAAQWLRSQRHSHHAASAYQHARSL